MKSYWKLIPKYLHKQKKQSVLIGVSIILSVMLISVIGNIGETIQDTLLEQVKNITGDYHASYNFVNQEQVSILKNDSRVDEVGTTLFLGDGVIANSTLQISVYGYDEQMLSMKRVELLDGKLPVNNNEIVIEEWLFKELGESVGIGSEIEIELKQEETTYEENLKFIISGIVKDNPSSKSLGLSIAYVTPEQVISVLPDTENSYRAIVHVKENQPIVKTIGDLKNQLKLNDEQYSPNDSLLEELESDWSSNYMILILGLCIIVAAIMMIYNVFYIMVTENVKEFGKLRTLGASSKQVRNIILGQGVIIAIVSIPVGILVGALITKCLGTVVNGVFDFNINRMIISTGSIVFSCIIGLFTTIIAALSPARLAGKVSPIEALNTTEKGTKVKKKDFVGKVFGNNMELAYRNLQRDKKKTRVTILSISMGIVLMIVFSFYIGSLEKNYVNGVNAVGNYMLMSQGDSEYDVGIDSDVIEQISKIRDVQKIYGVSYTTCEWTVYTEENINENLKAVFSVFKDQETNEYSIASNLYGYDEETMKLCERYLVEGTIDWQEINQGKGVLVLENMTCFGGDVETLIHAGDEIVLKKITRNGNDIQWEEPQTVKVMGVLSGLPIKQSESVMGLTMVTSKTVYSELTNYNTMQHVELKVNDHADEAIMKQLFEDFTEEQFVSVLSMKEVIKQRKQEQKNVTFLGCALIGVIILIGYMNMRNTIKTSLLRRKREFGMLRAIGISYKKITRIISLEGIIYGILSGVLGAALGNIVSYIFFVIEEENMNLTWQTPWLMTICALVGSILVGYVSSKRAMKSIVDISIIESIESI